MAWIERSCADLDGLRRPGGIPKEIDDQAKLGEVTKPLGGDTTDQIRSLGELPFTSSPLLASGFFGLDPQDLYLATTPACGLSGTAAALDASVTSIDHDGQSRAMSMGTLESGPDECLP